MLEHVYPQLKSVSAYRSLLQEPAGTLLTGLFGALAHGEGSGP